MIRSAWLAIAVCLVMTGASFAQQSTQADERQKAIRQIRENFKAALLNDVEKIQKAKAANKQALRDKTFSETLPPFVKEAWKLVEADATDRTAYETLVWLMEQQAMWFLVDRKLHWKIVQIIEEHHRYRDDLEPVIFWLRWLELDTSIEVNNQRKTEFVTKLLTESPHKTVRGTACHTLALWDFSEYERLVSKPDPDIQACRKLAGSAEKRFSRIEKEFADVPFQSSPKERAEIMNLILEKKAGKPLDQKSKALTITTPLGELARGYLAELRTLGIGMNVPKLAGTDFGGTVWDVRKQEGKVVVIVFWASWCGPCLARIPHENKLAERMKGRPFQLIGVNGDEEREAGLQATKGYEIKWPSVRAYGKDKDSAAILKDWNIRRWPTLYVVDHRGVIRAKDIHGDDLDKVVDRLVSEAEGKKESKP